MNNCEVCKKEEYVCLCDYIIPATGNYLTNTQIDDCNAELEEHGK